MRFETAGLPTAVVATDRFSELARRAGEGFGLPEARIATVKHPVGGIDSGALKVLAQQASEQLISLLVR